MKKLILVLLDFILTSCFSFQENKENRLSISEGEILKMTFNCGDRTIALNPSQISYLAEKINSSEHIGPVKGIVKKNLTIYLKNSDTINVRLIGKKYKWDKSGDWAYELDIDDNYLKRLCFKEKELVDSLKCNTSVVLEAYKNKDKISEDLLLKFLETFGKDCRSNAEFSEFSNGTLFKIIQKNPELFVKTLNNNLSKIDFDEVLFNLENPVNDLIDLDLTIKKIADIQNYKSVKDKVIIAINSGNWDESKRIQELKAPAVMFFIPDSIQFNSIANSDNSDGIYEVSGDFEFYATKIIELYADSTINVNISDRRFFIANNKLIDKFEQESPYGIIFVKKSEFKIKTGVFTDDGIQQMISKYFKDK